ncbi:M17 family metallopeptidase [Cellulomonas sp. KRMCY2]|uniref:leucyl aminopeptidase family protein n=1 Tax=Cellulomonas sp. KRMCY2 TaxID=1304865 RepID=UPI00045EC556|nr:leucyl aminopeptidase family protein [Cellulomonas sp. KRMCY2]
MSLVAPLPEVVVSRGSVLSTQLLTGPEVDALVVPVAPPAEGDEGVQPRTGTADAAARFGVDLGELADRLEMTGAAGDATTLHLPRSASVERELPWSRLPATVVVVGVGAGTLQDLRRAGAAIARSTRGMRRVVTTVGADAGSDGTRALVEGYLLGAYRHPTRATGKPAKAPAASLVLLGRYTQAAVDAAGLAAMATWTARTLTVTPSDTKNPAWLAERAAELATAAGLTVEVLGPQELAARGFGGLLAVGGGSATGPRLVTVRYEPPAPAPTRNRAGTAAGPARPGSTPRHIVLVGKGITYDTGGISIKPRESMVPMKTDMAGAAVVLATVLGAAAAGVQHRVTALLPLAENAFGGSSYRPGDVLRLYGGTTVEITNTDAEGRIVLADALSHADADLDPDVLIDVATLTGAATLGLGKQHGALYTAEDALACALQDAGDETGELLWRMPLVADYRPVLDSDVADLRHVPVDPHVGGGSITAALFLQRFVGDRRWAHLDIAGPARATAASHELPEGATGFGARLLLRWLTQLR